MVESYAVEASLEWKTNVPEVLRQMLSGFEQVNRAIAGLKDALGELSAGSRGISSIVRQLDKLKVPTQALDGIREMGSLTRGLAEAQGLLAKEAMETARAWREMAEVSKRVRSPGAGVPASGGLRRGGGHVSALDAAMSAQMAGDAGMGLLERGFGAYADVQLNTAMAQSDKRVSDAVIGRANSLISALQKQYPALTQNEGMTLFRNSMGIFGDADEALKALPGAARLQQLYQLAPIGRGGSGGSEVQAAEKAGDALQAFINPQTGKLDVGLYQNWMDFQARSYQAGGGLIDAKAWLAFARTSRSSGIGLSGRALEEAQALLEMSPGRTGTAMMSAFQVFGASTSHMTNKNRAAWGSAGLLGKGGDIFDRELYQSDPFEWVWKDMLPALKRRGISTRDQILRWLTDHGQRGTVAGLLSDIAIGQTPISNTALKMESQDPSLVDKLVNTDTGKLAALHAAETNFLVALGKFGEGPGLALLTTLTNALNKLVSEAEAHPEAAKRLIEVGGGLALISKIAGDATMASIFVGGPLLKGLGGLAGVLMPFKTGGAAAGALERIGASGGAGSLIGLAGGIIAVGAALLALPPFMKWLLTPNDPNNQFHGNGLGGGRGGTWDKGAPPSSGLEDWWRGFSAGVGAAPGANSRRGSVHPSAYVPDGQGQPITLHATFQMDGRTFSKVALKTMARSMNLGVSYGKTGFDGSMDPERSGPPLGLGT